MFALRARHAFDGHRFVDGGLTVFVDGVRIVGVESGSSAVPDGCPVDDHGDATVLPGLIDTHVHLVTDSGPAALDRVAGYDDEQLNAVVTDSLQRHLAGGVTTVRDLGDRGFAVVDRRNTQGSTDDAMPHVLASGPPITSPGGHCWYLGGQVSSPDDMVAAVHQRVERGVDIIKVMASGGMNTPGTDVTAPQFATSDLRLIVEESHRAGLPVTAHAHAASAIDQAIAVGVDGIEHASYLVKGEGVGLLAAMNTVATDEQLATLARSGVVVCPTLGGLSPEFYRMAPKPVLDMIAKAGVTPEQIVEMRMELLRRMHGADVRFVSGTDGGIVPPKAHGTCRNAVVELARVVGAEHALATATALAADACGLGASKGRLRREFDADLLVVDGDLEADLTRLANVRRVVLRGSAQTMPDLGQ